MSFRVADEICVHIRWMVRRDMQEVMEIERESFEFPWSEDDFVHILRRRNCIGMVAEYKGEVVGFIVYELGKNKIHLINIAVATRFRRLAVGTQLMAKLIGKLNYQHRNRITFEIRETNLRAQLFFKSIGFQVTQILHDYYEEMNEDAYLMQYRYIAEDYDRVMNSLSRRMTWQAG
ncbi:MAG: ribosomal protein S18-alanine N-acetyltransferase [Planctomycetaceae bacterium]|jgi:ribosomal-protein-alanine N-acetyltransferase|nr:ribosomal protein S18-alanine N-acetyltransferase [Planctomycetaceae bacterium]